MNDNIQNEKCSSCVHWDVCSLKGEYLKLMDALPEVSGPFKVTLNCSHYKIAYGTIRTDSQEKFWTTVNATPAK